MLVLRGALAGIVAVLREQGVERDVPKAVPRNRAGPTFCNHDHVREVRGALAAVGPPYVTVGPDVNHDRSEGLLSARRSGSVTSFV